MLRFIYCIQMFECSVCQAQARSQETAVREAGRVDPYRACSLGQTHNFLSSVDWEACHTEPAWSAVSQSK